jgi:hypothetical protein
MKQILSIAAVLVFLAVSATGQEQSQEFTPCRLTVAQSPVIRGLKLEMTAEELFNIFPENVSREWSRANFSRAQTYPSMGVSYYQLDPAPINLTDRSPFEVLTVTFLDRRLVGMRLTYRRFPDGPQWPASGDFVARLVESYHLPASQSWVIDNDQSRHVQCNGFLIRAGILGGTGYFALEDNSYQKVQKERRNAYEETIRRDFKP